CFAGPSAKTYPEIHLDYTRFKFPVLARKFPVPSQKFPVLLSREFCLQASEFARVSAFKIAPSGRIRRNSLLISLLAGNSGVETGSIWTASATTQSSDP